MPLLIGAVANPQHAHGRNFIRGVNRYVSEQRPDIVIDLFIHDYPKSKKQLLQYDGFIAADTPDEIEALSDQIPVVRVGQETKTSNTVFTIDDYAIGALAAKTLHQRGVVTFGYYDAPHSHSEGTKDISRLRLKGYREAIQNHPTNLYDTSLSICDSPNTDQIYQWLKELPKPAGIFTFNDLGAITITETCHRHQIPIPDELTIIGVDNDRLLCSLNRPNISSIDTGMNQLSFDAMHHLIQRVESGDASPPLDQYTAPAPVAVLRETTGHCACPHPIIQQTLHEIGRIPPHHRSPSEISAAIGISLRSLELHVKKQLDSTVQNMLLEAQLKDVKQFLRTTEHTVEMICAEIDWDPSSLQRAFKRVTGQTVGAYRAQFRPNPPQTTTPKRIEKGSQLTIGIISTMSSQMHHELLRGMEDYCQSDPDIHLALHLSANLIVGGQPDFNLSQRAPYTQYDGFVLTTEVDCSDEILRSKPIMTVDHQRNQKQGAPFHVDNCGLGMLASQHFLQKGYTQFAYISFAPETAPNGNQAVDTRALDRYQGFFDGLTKAGIPKENILQSHYTGRDALNHWVAALPAKTAIFSFNDALSLQVIHAARRVERAIPDDIAILSADNDAFLCNLSKPRLSSIDIEFRKAGYQMIQALVDIIRKTDVPTLADSHIRPRHIIERESTQALGTNDADLEAAIHYIQTHYPDDIGIDDIVEATTLKRRSLETRFKKILSRSILKELQSTRLQAAADRLTGTSLSVKEISLQCGFKSSRNFCKDFKGQTGKTPLEYRNPKS